MSETPSEENTSTIELPHKDVPPGTPVLEALRETAGIANVAEPTPPSPPVLQAPGTPLNVAEPPPPDPFIKDFDAMVEKVRASNDPLLLGFIEFMSGDEKTTMGYISAMDPKNIAPLAKIPGATMQKNFFLAMRKVIEKSPPGAFRKNWSVVLAYFYRYREGVLNERYVNRFSEYWQNKDPMVPVFQKLVNLCLVSRDPKDRQTAAKHVDINRTMEIGYSPTGESNIKQFYGV